MKRLTHKLILDIHNHIGNGGLASIDSAKIRVVTRTDAAYFGKERGGKAESITVGYSLTFKGSEQIIEWFRHCNKLFVIPALKKATEVSTELYNYLTSRGVNARLEEYPCLGYAD